MKNINIQLFKIACLNYNRELIEVKITYETVNNKLNVKLYIKAEWFNESIISKDLDTIIEIFKSSKKTEPTDYILTFILLKNDTEGKKILGYRTLGIEH